MQQRTKRINRRMTAALLAGAMAATMLTSRAQANPAVYRETLKSTAWVLTRLEQGIAFGSGVLVDEERRLVLTNYHVVSDAREALVFFPQTKEGGVIAEKSYYTSNAEQLGITSKVIAIDRRRDLALIELPKLPDGVPEITMAEQGATPGQRVHSLGNPGTTGVLWVYTSGTVRAVYNKKFRTQAGEHEFRVLETQSPINGGDSGGPVVNDAGELVGISQALATQARLVSYCVDISEIRVFLAGDWKPAPRPVNEVLLAADVEYKQNQRGSYVAAVETGDDRRDVYVAGDTEYYGKVEVRKVWALAGSLQQPPPTGLLMTLMKQNARTKLGSWSIEQSGDGDYLILFVAKVDATASPDSLKSSMEYVARIAAALEKELNPPEQPQTAAQSWFGGP